MYLEYYSLERPPFRITPDPSLFFTGGANGRGVVLEALLYAVTSGEGILKVVGEVGSGKTMLCRMLEERLPESVEVVYLANPNLSAQDILYAIAFELKISVDHNTQRLVLMHCLQEYLLKQHAANRTVLVIIEEAQSMPIATLEEVRLFSNLETHQHKLMQIILFGQPELDQNLQNKAIRQLRERITHSFYLRPLTVNETSDYIRFRLQAAGCSCPQVFSDAAEKMIARASGGLTRRINILADKAMLAAYAESSTTVRPRNIGNQLTPTVMPRHVRAAIKDSGYVTTPWTATRIAAVAFAVLVLLALGLWWQIGLGSGAALLPLHVDSQVGATQDSLALVTSPEFITATPVVATEVTDFMDADSLVLVAPAQVPSAGMFAAVEPEGLPEPIPEALSPLSVTSELPALLESRRLATALWVGTVRPATYVVQLLSIDGEESRYVDLVLQRLEQAGVIDRTYVCLAEGRERMFWKVVYGSFDSVMDARQFMANLPASIRSNNPFIQNVARLECDLSRDANRSVQEY